MSDNRFSWDVCTARSSAKRVPLGSQVWETDADSETSDEHKKKPEWVSRGGSAFSQPAIGLLYPSRHTCPGIQYGTNTTQTWALLCFEEGCWVDQGVDSGSRKPCTLSWLIPSLDKVTPMMSKITVQAGKEKIFCVTPLSFSIMQCIGWDRIEWAQTVLQKAN